MRGQAKNPVGEITVHRPVGLLIDRLFVGAALAHRTSRVQSVSKLMLVFRIGLKPLQYGGFRLDGGRCGGDDSSDLFIMLVSFRGEIDDHTGETDEGPSDRAKPFDEIPETETDATLHLGFARRANPHDMRLDHDAHHGVE